MKQRSRVLLWLTCEHGVSRAPLHLGTELLLLWHVVDQALCLLCWVPRASAHCQPRPAGRPRATSHHAIEASLDGTPGLASAVVPCPWGTHIVESPPALQSPLALSCPHSGVSIQHQGTGKQGRRHHPPWPAVNSQAAHRTEGAERSESTTPPPRAESRRRKQPY